jgi:S1-C subfamily serine protease
MLALLWAAAACGPDGASVAVTAEAAESTGASLTELAERSGPVGEPSSTPAPQTPSQSIDASRSTAIVRAAERAAPAVVNVSVIRQQQVRPRTMYESFFIGPNRQRRTAGWGSGVVVREDGIVLTNHHVVREADQIKVTLPDGRDFTAELVGSDPVADIAVLRIPGDDLPVAPVGSSDGLLIGEWAVAIGNPFANYFSDAEPTVTAGVISALNRNIMSSSEEDGFYLGMIQTDASINPGNSGGPLVDALGRVIGINASIFSRSGGSEGLGFAIPIDRALRIADELVRYGEVRRAWIGVEVEPVEADAWGRTRGVRVSEVAAGSPSDAALRVGDRLLTANGRALAAPLDFESVLLDLSAGESLELQVEGQARSVRIRSESLPSLTAERITVLQDIELITVTPQIRSERGLASEQGALIAAIPGGLSAQLGLREGDVILQVNRTRVQSAEQVARTFESLRGRGSMRIWFERNGGVASRDLYWR